MVIVSLRVVQLDHLSRVRDLRMFNSPRESSQRSLDRLLYSRSLSHPRYFARRQHSPALRLLQHLLAVAVPVVPQVQLALQVRGDVSAVEHEQVGGVELADNEMLGRRLLVEPYKVLLQRRITEQTEKAKRGVS